MTGSTTVPPGKSPDCDCSPGTSAVECVKDATTDETMDHCFGTDRILIAKGLLLALYLAAASAFVATVELGMLARKISPKQAS